MVKTGGATQNAQTHFEQVPLDVVEKVLGRDAVRTHGGTKRPRGTAARRTKPHSPERLYRNVPKSLSSADDDGPTKEAGVRSILRHREGHRTGRIGWLRAAVLGANDGIVSTASLVVGVAAAGAVRKDILLAGVAGAVAGALSMAAGEYVSVSSQADTEQADLALERSELAANEDAEQRELAAIYVRRGLEPALARTVAQQLMAQDALGAHARDELGLSDQLAARPLQAALASAVTFAVGALLPILAVMLPPQAWVVAVVSGSSLICLAALGALATQVGGGSAWRGAMRVAFWGALAMVATAGVGALFGTTVG